MDEVYLIRTVASDQGTQGVMASSRGFHSYSLELPWRGNQSNISCIPPGRYHTQIRISPKYGKIYWVTEVPNRGWILCHSGNWAGDVALGFKTHVKGCILLGSKMGFLENQLAILNSRVTVRKFMNHMAYEPFWLNVIGGITQ